MPLVGMGQGYKNNDGTERRKFVLISLARVVVQILFELFLGTYGFFFLLRDIGRSFSLHVISG